MSPSNHSKRTNDSGKWSFIFFIVLLVVMIIYSVTKSNRLDETIEACSRYGIDSTTCQQKQSTYHIECRKLDDIGVSYRFSCENL